MMRYCSKLTAQDSVIYLNPKEEFEKDWILYITSGFGFQMNQI